LLEVAQADTVPHVTLGSLEPVIGKMIRWITERRSFAVNLGNTPHSSVHHQKTRVHKRKLDM
jgi:hypothetical protein